METRRAYKNTHADAGTWAGTGIIGGVLAGVAMVTAAMVWMALVGQGFFKPLDVIASILMGKAAINPGFQVVPELVGIMIHLALSTLFGFFFAFAVSRASWPSGAIIGAALAYGLLLWIVNVVIIDANFVPAGLSLAPTPLMIVVHLVFGLVLGLVAAPKLSRDH